MKVDMSLVAQVTERCNLRCVYCYLKEKKPRDMSLETAEKLVESFLSYNYKFGHFTWVGGEPLLLGDDFLRKLIEYGKKYNSRGLNVSHSIQTNGLELEPKRREELRSMGFKIGTSFDGCIDLQNSLRGSSTSDEIFGNIVAADRSLGVIAVLTRKMVGREQEVYTNLRKLTTRARINLYTPSGEGLSKVDELLPTKEEALGSILAFYEMWKADDSEFIFNPFNSLVRGFFTGWPKTCEYSAYSCYRLLGADTQGNIFLCSRSTHFPQTLLGNIHQNRLEEMVGSATHELILDRYLKLKDGQCKECGYLSLCSGGCPVEALSYTGEIMNKTYYCEVKGGLFKKIEENLKDEGIGRRLARKIGIKR